MTVLVLIMLKILIIVHHLVMVLRRPQNLGEAPEELEWEWAKHHFCKNSFPNQKSHIRDASTWNFFHKFFCLVNVIDETSHSNNVYVFLVSDLISVNHDFHISFQWNLRTSIKRLFLVVVDKNDGIITCIDEKQIIKSRKRNHPPHSKTDVWINPSGVLVGGSGLWLTCSTEVYFQPTGFS